MVPLRVQILTDDLPSADWVRLVEECGWMPATDGPRVALTRCFGVDTLQSCLEPPGHGGIEAGEAEFVPPNPHFSRHLGQGGLALSLSTVNAYQYDLAQTFTTGLGRHHPDLDDEVMADLGLAIHELVANALIHGNLGVSSPEPGLDGFDAYCRALDRALADGRLIARSVEISAMRDGDVIEVAVKDHGDGYDPSATKPVDGTCSAQARNHGLSMVGGMGKIRVEDGGRCALVRFPLDRPS